MSKYLFTLVCSALLTSIAVALVPRLAVAASIEETFLCEPDNFTASAGRNLFGSPALGSILNDACPGGISLRAAHGPSGDLGIATDRIFAVTPPDDDALPPTGNLVFGNDCMVTAGSCDRDQWSLFRVFIAEFSVPVDSVRIRVRQSSTVSGAFMTLSVGSGGPSDSGVGTLEVIGSSENAISSVTLTSNDLASGSGILSGVFLVDALEFTRILEPIPEPSTAFLIGIGLVGMAANRG